MAMNISFTFIEVFADVSMKSKLLSSAYDCASYWSETNRRSVFEVTFRLRGSTPGGGRISCESLMLAPTGLVLFAQNIQRNTNLEVQCSLVCEISLVPSQSDYNVRTGLPLKLFNPVLRPYK